MKEWAEANQESDVRIDLDEPVCTVCDSRMALRGRSLYLWRCLTPGCQTTFNTSPFKTMAWCGSFVGR